MSEERNYEVVASSDMQSITLPKKLGEGHEPYVAAFKAATGRLIDRIVDEPVADKIVDKSAE